MSNSSFQYDTNLGRWIENCAPGTADWLRKSGFSIGPPAYPVDCDERMKQNIDKMVGIYKKND